MLLNYFVIFKFIASGPKFKKGFKVKNFSNVDIYSLMCKVLEIEPGVHNGSLEIVQNVLIIDQTKYKTGRKLNLS